MFLDEKKLYIEAGRGGDGAVSFLHEKYREFGGPDGGDGGKGGNVCFIADRNLQSLSHLTNKQQFKAEHGQQGGGAKKTGKNGLDVTIKVPLGTLIIDIDTNEILVDLNKDKLEYIAARGGKGGAGNWHFKSSTNRAPRKFKSGHDGEKRNIKLELKIIADIGLVGFPNAGKSSLLSVITHANPKVANYPFSTLHPNLGTLYLDNFNKITIADIPGLIEGAHEGLGLGTKFLKHIERTKFIFYLIDITDEDIIGNLQKLEKELDLYHEDLKNKESIIILNKIDLVIEKEIDEAKNKLIDKGYDKDKIFTISNMTNAGIDILIKYLYTLELSKD